MNSKQNFISALIIVSLIVVVSLSMAQADAVFAFENASYTIKVYENLTLKPILQDAEIQGKATYTWASENDGIAKVRNGQITGVKAGETTITCTLTDQSDAVYTASVKIIVIQPVKSLRIKDFTLSMGQTKPLDIEILPEDATNKTLRYTVSDPNIATIDEDGNIKGLSVGYVQITAETTDGSNKKVIKKIPVYSFFIETEEIVLDERRTYQLNLPDYGNTMLYIKYDKSALSIGNIAWETYFGIGEIYNWNPSKKANDLVKEYGNGPIFIKINPRKAGTTYIRVLDLGKLFNAFRPGYSQNIKVVVTNDALYNTVSFPKLKYSSAADDAMVGTQVSFTNGVIVEVTEYEGHKAWNVATRNKLDDQVIVVLPDGAECDLGAGEKINVFGMFIDPLTSVSETGLRRTLPVIQAEKVNDLIFNPAIEELDYTTK